MDIIISMEATCDLSRELIKKYDLKIVDMDFVIDGVSYTTAIDDVKSTKLYEKMRAGSKTSTSQVNESVYESFFEGLIKEGKPILHLAFSSGLSNTYLSAKSVAEKLNKKYGTTKIYVVDSLCACGGHGMFGILVRKYAGRASGIEDIVTFAETIKHNLNHCFSVDALKYLANGGRIKRSSATLGTLLNIKPVMRMDEMGKLVVVNKVISRKKALLAICNKLKNTYNKNYDFCFISHADCLKDAEFISNNIKDTGLKIYITDLGPVIGCHSGPGTISLYFVSNFGR